MKTLVLSTFVLSSTLSSFALAEPRSLVEPAPNPVSIAPTDGKPAATRLAPALSNATPADRRTYLSQSTTLAPEAEGEPVSLQGELGTRLGDGPAFFHASAGRGVGLSIFDISMWELRGGVEARSRGAKVRGFGGVDLGAWIISSDVDSETVFEVVPRLGVEVGDRVWFRGAIQMPLFVEYLDEIDPTVLVTLGVGAEL